jgi:hypothetical protein
MGRDAGAYARLGPRKALFDISTVSHVAGILE